MLCVWTVAYCPCSGSASASEQSESGTNTSLPACFSGSAAAPVVRLWLRRGLPSRDPTWRDTFVSGTRTLTASAASVTRVVDCAASALKPENGFMVGLSAADAETGRAVSTRADPTRRGKAREVNSDKLGLLREEDEHNDDDNDDDDDDDAVATADDDDDDDDDDENRTDRTSELGSAARAATAAADDDDDNPACDVDGDGNEAADRCVKPVEISLARSPSRASDTVSSL
jgi:hypothetical protein